MTVEAIPRLAPPSRFRATQCRSTITIARVTDDPGEARLHSDVFQVRCGCWRCQGCGRRLRQLHGQLIEAGYRAHRGQVWRFLTLTLPADTGARVDRAEDCANVSLMFRRWVQMVRRTYGPLDYYAVKEHTKRGRLHLHALATGTYLPKCRRTLPGGCIHGCAPCPAGGCHRAGGCLAVPTRRPCIQALAWRVGLGFVDVRMVHGEGAGAARYVGKYLGKQHIGQPWPRYSRRCSYSRNLAPGVTIGRLSAEWSERSYRLGVEAGHIRPPTHPFDGRTRYRLLDQLRRRGPPAAWLSIGPAVDRTTGEIIEAPTVALTELAAIRRHNRRTETEARLIAGDVDTLDPDTARLIYTEAARRAHTAY